MLMSFWRLLADLTRSFLRHGCASLAASLAFFSLLSLFPLVFMLLYGVSFIVSHEVIGGQVLLSFLKGFLPTLGERLAVELQRISELETVRWLVFLSFAWFGTLVFYELDYALNVVFDSTWKRHPLISTAIAVASQGAVALMLVLSYVATQTVNFLTAYAPHLWGLDLIALAAHDVFLTYTLPFTMAFLTVGALYRYVPRRRPQWREALIGVCDRLHQIVRLLARGDPPAALDLLFGSAAAARRRHRSRAATTVSGRCSRQLLTGKAGFPFSQRRWLISDLLASSLFLAQTTLRR